jgi:hypothetical protein
MNRSVLATLLCVSLATTGCTLAGAAVGASMPRYEHAEWPRTEIALGSEVRVHLRNVGADSVQLEEITGRYGGVHDGVLSVTDEAGHEHELAVRDVVDVEVSSGTQWAKGLALGAVTDAVVVATAIAIANGANVSIATGR